MRFQPYAEFFFMDDKTHQQIAPAALFRSRNPLDPVSQQLLHQLQQSFAERPGTGNPVYAGADCGGNRCPQCGMHIHG